MAPALDPMVGRYLRLQIDGVDHRVYFEEAGQGIPLVCLHTAGSDGRQYRAILNDPAITAHFRVVVFDMPWHGKSSPPAGWEDQEYRLTTDGYVALIMHVCRELELDRPVAMGCSITGRAAVSVRRVLMPSMCAAAAGDPGPWLERAPGCADADRFVTARR